MPMWVDGPDGTPYRPWGGVWVSLETGVVNVKLAEADGGDATLALDALLELGFKFARTRPAAIQVADHALGALRSGPRLEDLGERDEALAHVTVELLRLNPADGQGARCALLEALLLTGRDDEAGTLLRQFGDEPSALWQYRSALWAFRRAAALPGLTRGRVRRFARTGICRPSHGRQRANGRRPSVACHGQHGGGGDLRRRAGDAWKATRVEWLVAHAPAGNRRKRHRR